MDLTSKSTVKKILKKHNLRPSKYLGQYFLVDKRILKKITETARLTKEDTVIEIGPGIGTLTQELAKIAKKVIAVEKDEKMCQILKETLKLQIVNEDILKLQIKNLKLKINKYKIVANLPYYIASPVIRKFLEADFPPKEMVLLIQKEVAQRICAKPGKMSILAIAVQFYAKPEIIKIVSKKAFWPVPKVDSAILRIGQIFQPKNIDKNRFFKTVKIGFSSPRKQLVNNLSNGLKLNKGRVKEILKKIKINPKARAQELSVKDWIKILKLI